MEAPAQTTPAKINLENYSIQELATLRKRLEDDITTILDSYNGFKYLFKKFEDAKILVQNVSKQKGEECEILVPLSNSLYIPGRIADTNRFIVDIGTGYFAERTGEQTVQYCDHTLDVIKVNGEKMVREINAKQQMRDQINIEMHKKYAQRTPQPASEDFKKKDN